MNLIDFSQIEEAFYFELVSSQSHRSQEYFETGETITFTIRLIPILTSIMPARVSKHPSWSFLYFLHPLNP